jgi:hypothetical protein
MNMQMETKPNNVDVFVSYSSHDRNQVLQIVDILKTAGLHVWIDQFKIPGGTNYGPEIVRSIKDCCVLIIMCSDSSMRSKNVKQEIQLAWKYSKPYLPLLLEHISFPEQVEYWLEGWQWIEIMDFPPDQWLPPVMEAIIHAGVQHSDLDKSLLETHRTREPNTILVQPVQPKLGLAGLRTAASFTDQIWPIPAPRLPRVGYRSTSRGLGAPQESLQHGYKIGNRVCLAIESDLEGQLLLLDEGPEGIVYCLCPSWFAPDTRLHAGRSYLPQENSPYDSFLISGEPGREHLLAIISQDPLDLNWMPPDAKKPARTLSQDDINSLLQILNDMEGDRWIALSTYFDIKA